MQDFNVKEFIEQEFYEDDERPDQKRLIIAWNNFINSIQSLFENATHLPLADDIVRVNNLLQFMKSKSVLGYLLNAINGAEAEGHPFLILHILTIEGFSRSIEVIFLPNKKLERGFEKYTSGNDNALTSIWLRKASQIINAQLELFPDYSRRLNKILIGEQRLGMIQLKELCMYQSYFNYNYAAR